MLLRAIFALALVCLVPFHEPNIGISMPHTEGLNQQLVDLRQRLMIPVQRAAREIRNARAGEFHKKLAQADQPDALVRQ
jgi:hypothetical protein